MTQPPVVSENTVKVHSTHAILKVRLPITSGISTYGERESHHRFREAILSPKIYISTGSGMGHVRNCSRKFIYFLLHHLKFAPVFSFNIKRLTISADNNHAF